MLKKAEVDNPQKRNVILFEKMRKAKPKKHVILPDPVFNDVKVSKFVNHLMYDGKKSISYSIFYAALEAVKNKMQMKRSLLLKFGRRLWTM